MYRIKLDLQNTELSLQHLYSKGTALSDLQLSAVAMTSQKKCCAKGLGSASTNCSNYIHLL